MLINKCYECRVLNIVQHVIKSFCYAQSMDLHNPWIDPVQSCNQYFAQQSMGLLCIPWIVRSVLCAKYRLSRQGFVLLEVMGYTLRSCITSHS